MWLPRASLEDWVRASRRLSARKTTKKNAAWMAKGDHTWGFCLDSLTSKPTQGDLAKGAMRGLLMLGFLFGVAVDLERTQGYLATKQARINTEPGKPMCVSSVLFGKPQLLGLRVRRVYPRAKSSIFGTGAKRGGSP